MAKPRRIVIKKQRSTASNLAIGFFRNYHLLIFFIIVAALLAVGVIMLNNALLDTSSKTYTPSITSGSIDQATLDRVESLHTSDAPATPELPSSGRINPFAE